MRHIVLLGSTGSIGTQTLDVLRHQPGCACVEALAAGGHRLDLLEQQTREFHPQLVAVYEETAARDLSIRLKDMDVRVVSGMEGLLGAVALESADMVVTAMVGMIGFFLGIVATAFCRALRRKSADSRRERDPHGGRDAGHV